ncbi:ATP-binding protein [Paenibacillus marinisediminis]
MLVALKETLLQVFIACLPAFACQIYLMKPSRITKAHIYIGFFSVISVLLCMMFSFYYYKTTAHPFDFRLIPFAIGILYGGYRIGAGIVLLYILILYGFDLTQLTQPLWTDPLLYITPVLFFYINRFRTSNLGMRIYITMNFALLGMVLYIVFYSLELWENNIDFHSDVFLFMAMFGFVFMIAACSTVYFIESVREKAYFQLGYLNMSHKYRQEMQKLNHVMDTTPLGVIAVNADAEITNINQTLLNIIKEHSGQYELREFIGQSYRDVFNKIRLWDSDDLLIFRVLQGEPMQSEVRIIGDRTYFVHTKSMQNPETEEIVGAVGMLHDITELTQLRAEIGNMERLSLVGQMAASITHEIRNPMAVVRGFIQLMKEKNPGHMEEYYNIVMEELDRANGIINDFLSLAQDRIVKKEETQLHELIHHVAPLLWADAHLRGQEIVLELGDSVPELLLNPKEMKQLILNLARNGMEAMQEKGVLTIATQYDEKLSTVELLVSDTGSGISEPTREKLFEPFYTTKSKGTGLGLPLCLSIVERHDGTIRVESELGKGTSFIVTFRTHKHQVEAASSGLESPQLQAYTV